MSLSALSAYQCLRGEPAEEAKYSLQTGKKEEGGRRGWSRRAGALLYAVSLQHKGEYKSGVDIKICLIAVRVFVRNTAVLLVSEAMREK